MKKNSKIAIACQGGGSHTAFTAGVLKKLLEEGVHQEYDLVGLSGTSGGAICATATLYGLLKTANGSEEPPYNMLENHIDFKELQSLIKPSSPRLFLGAVDILSGTFKAFDSLEPNEIRAETLMASAGIPTLFKAVEIDGTAYWDGLFSQNPPLSNFLQLDAKQKPNEIWVIKINPLESKTIPKTGEDIIDRRNELSGNLSLYKQIQFIEFINHLIGKNVFKEELKDKYKTVTIRWIAMSEEVTDRLDYTSKLERNAEFIDKLMAEGEKQAEIFCKAD